MTDETRTGGEATGAVEQASTSETPAPRRRRRAAAPAGPPETSAPDAGTPAAEPGSAATESSEPAEPATRRSRARAGTASGSAARPRRARSAAGTGATGATDGSDDVQAAAPAPDMADVPAEAPAAPARRSRGRASKAVAQAPADEASTTSDASAAAAVEEQAETPAPRRQSGRRRAGTARSADASTAATAENGEGGEAADAPAEATSSTTRGGGTPRLATTALLFQAPEPTSGRPRRRRASAPAGPPRHADEATETAVAPAAGSREEGAEEELDEAPEAAEVAEAAEVVGADGTPDSDEASDEAHDEGDDDHDGPDGSRRRRRRGGRGRRGRSGDRAVESTDDAEAPAADGTGSAAGDDEADEAEQQDGEAADGGEGSASSRRRRRRRRSRGEGPEEPAESRPRNRQRSDEVTALKGSTRLEAKRQRRREGRDAGRRRTIITEAEFLARRESVERTMVVRELAGRVQIGILEDGVLVEHYVSRSAANTQAPMAGNVYLGRVQNVLPSMEAAFVDIGKGRNAVLYAGEVNWDAAGLEGQPRRIEQALKSGDAVLVQVTKEPVGHKGARLTSQITLAGRYLVYVPGGGMTGISRKLPENERARLKRILREIVPDDAGVIVRTAAEGASDDELRLDVQRLQDQWAAIQKKAGTASPPALLQGEPDLAIRVVRDVFNDDFDALVVQGEEAWDTISDYVGAMAPDLAGKVSRWTGDGDVFAAHRVDEQLAKGMERKVWLPSGGSLVIDRTEAMTVIDVNTGKFTGSGGTLEETVTRNNLEAAEEIVRQLRLRDIGGIIVIDFIDMVLESNRDLVLRRLVECLGRDRTKHQVAEVTSLGLVQMTRKRVGQGLLEAFSEPCPHCGGRGYLIHSEPVNRANGDAPAPGAEPEPKKARRKRAAAATSSGTPAAAAPSVPVLPEAREAVKATLATIAAAAAHAHEQASAQHHDDDAAEVADHVAPSDASVELADALSSVSAVELPTPGAPDDAAGRTEPTEPTEQTEQTEPTEPALTEASPED